MTAIFRTALLAGTVLALAAAPAQSGNSSSRGGSGLHGSGLHGSGLHGTVTKGPTTPVCVAGTPCTAPAKGVTVVFIRARIAHRVTTDSQGRYRITLAPGTYSVSSAMGRRFTPTTATVRAGHYGLRNFSIDTGIR